MRQIMGRLKYYAAMVLFVLTSGILSVGPAMAVHADDNNQKVFVCKYVGTPGVNESLQTGDNPIDVSINSIKNYQGVGSYFNDAQGLSYVLALDTGQTKPDSSACPNSTAPTPITPLPVTFTEPTCTQAGYYTIPSDTGVLYEDPAGTVLTAGNYPVTSGESVTINAVAASTAYTLTGTTTWSHPFSTPNNCNVLQLAVPTTPTITTQAACGATDEVVTPPVIAGVVWTPSSATTLAVGDSVTYVATPATGYYFAGNVSSESFTLKNSFDTSTCGQVQPLKVYVCKYVGTPGVDERLQTGQNPIDVSVNAIGESPVVVGSYFNDAQGRSYVLAFDTGQTPPDASACPATQVHTVTPGAVTFTHATCEDISPLGTYTIPPTTGVDYEIGGNVVPAGTYDVTVPGTVTVTAVAANSAYTLSGTTQWSDSFAEVNGCGGGESIQPNLVVTPSACVESLQTTGTVTVAVTNPNLTSVTYNVVLGTGLSAQSKSVTVAAGATQDVQFTNLAAGTYPVEVSGQDDTDVTTSVTIATCQVTTTTGGGHVLGASTGFGAGSAAVSELANTGTSTVLPTILAISMALTATGIMLGDYMRRKSAASDPTL